jgi:thioredoxin reductase (NADPH)
MTEEKKTDFEIIIIGGGPAGLTAGMYAGRGMMDALIIERGMPGGQLLNTHLIEDYPGFESVGGAELAQKMTDHAKKFGATIIMDTVLSISRDSDGNFEILTQLGDTYRAPAALITAGGLPNKLGVPGEEEFAGKGVSYCAVCDGAFFKGEVLAVIGGGDAAAEEADYLTRYAEKVFLVHRRDELRASKLLQDRVFANPKIEMVWNKSVDEIAGPPTGVTTVKLNDTRTGEKSELDATGVFIFVGFTPNAGLIKEHYDHDEGGYIVTDTEMLTSVPGLYAAGDLRVQLTRQITTAVGDATTAVIAIEKYLTDRKQAQNVG